MNKQIGFIGVGNMARAMIGGIIAKGDYAPTDIHVSKPHPEELKDYAEETGVVVEATNGDVAKKSDILFMAIKPNIYPDVFAEIKNDVDFDTVVVTIAAGQSIALTQKRFGRPIKLVRMMPNTPALVGEGMSAFTPNKNLDDDDIATVKAVLESFGKAEQVPENLMDAVTAVSGSSPAFVFMFIEAMADGAVAAGMPRAKAYTFAAQTVLGSAKMVLETGKHPGELKDMVTSPGGTTIDGVLALEGDGFRAAVADAVMTAAEKSTAMTD